MALETQADHSTVFNSGIFVENATLTTFVGNRCGPCPNCGGMGHIPDGVFNFIGNTIEILSAPERTNAELKRLAEIIREARAKVETREQVASRIERELPSFSFITNLLPENKVELYGFLSLALTALASFTSLSATPHVTTVTVNQVINQAIVERPNTMTMPETTIPVKKPGRNEACPCGSGKKYKKCCGKIQ
jgi:hypothetical protein